MNFEWDPAKNAANLEKHGIDFPGAVRVFDGPTLTIPSPREGEPRWIAVGEVEGIGIAVVYTIRDGAHRIISARRARKNERQQYRALLAK